MIPTAEAILDILIPFKDNVSSEENEHSLEQNIDVLIGWAKLHCIEQAKVISEKANVYQHSRDYKIGVKSKIVRQKIMISEVDKDSILNAYDLNNIK